MNGSIHSCKDRWCGGGIELVRSLCDTFGNDNVFVRSPHHIQVRRESACHDVWISASNIVKYKLAGEAGRAHVAATAEQLLIAIRGHDGDRSDLAEMRKAVELSQLINAARAAMPLCGVSQAVFVDAGVKGDRAQIAVVRVAIMADGEHVRAESHPSSATRSDQAEEAAIQYAVNWAAQDDLIFSDNRSAVDRARKSYGDRIRWLPRDQNHVADRVANLRGKRKKRRGKRRRNKKPK